MPAKRAVAVVFIHGLAKKPAPEKLQEIVEQSRARSAVFDVLTNGVPVSMSVNAG